MSFILQAGLAILSGVLNAVKVVIINIGVLLSVLFLNFYSLYDSIVNREGELIQNIWLTLMKSLGCLIMFTLLLIPDLILNFAYGWMDGSHNNVIMLLVNLFSIDRSDIHSLMLNDYFPENDAENSPPPEQQTDNSENSPPPEQQTDNSENQPPPEQQTDNSENQPAAEQQSDNSENQPAAEQQSDNSRNQFKDMNLEEFEADITQFPERNKLPQQTIDAATELLKNHSLTDKQTELSQLNIALENYMDLNQRLNNVELALQQYNHPDVSLTGKEEVLQDFETELIVDTTLTNICLFFKQYHHSEDLWLTVPKSTYIESKENIFSRP